MRLGFSIVVVVSCMGVCFCGVINELRHTETQDNGKPREVTVDGLVNYSGSRSEVTGVVPEKALTNYDLNAPADSQETIPTIKQKRCPRQQVGQSPNPFTSSVLGAPTPAETKRREIQVQLSEKLCTRCRSSHQCKVLKKCELCKNWCNGKPAPEQPNSVTDALTDNVVGATNPKESKSQILKTGDRKENGPKVSIANRFSDIEDEDMKRIHTIATLKSGKLKEAICKLLGISDLSDIDTLVVWVTTHSNQPPIFSKGFKKQVSPEAEKQTEELNKELSRVLEKGGHDLTKDEIEQIVKRVVEQAQKDRKNSHGKSRSNMDDEFETSQSSENDNVDFNIPPTPLNPAVIQDTPNMFLGAEQTAQAVATEPRIGDVKEQDMAHDTDESQSLVQMAGGPLPEADGTEKAILTLDDSVNVNKATGGINPKTDDEITGGVEHKMDGTWEYQPQKAILIEKNKDKKPQKVQGGQIYSQVYGTNDEPEDKVGNVQSGENMTPEKKHINERLGTTKLIKKMKEKKAQKTQGTDQNAAPYYRANEDDIIGETNDGEADGHLRETGDTEKAISTLDDSANVNKATGGINPQTVDDITGLPNIPNPDDDEDSSEVEPKADGKLEDQPQKAISIEKNKDKEPQKTQGGQIYSQVYEANDESKDKVGNDQSGENVSHSKLLTKIPMEKSQTIDDPLQVDTEKEPEILSVDLDDKPKLISRDQEKVGSSTDDVKAEEPQKMEDVIEPVKNKDLSEAKTIGNDIVAAPEGGTSQESAFAESTPEPNLPKTDPLAELRARTQEIKDKIKQKIAQKKQLPGPRSHAEENKVDLPNTQGEEGTSTSEPEFDKVTSSEDKVGEKEPEMNRESDMRDHNGHEVIKPQLPLPNVLGGFDKARSVLEDVENMVDKLQKDTNIQEIGLLGETQPTADMDKSPSDKLESPNTASEDSSPSTESSDLGVSNLEESPNAVKGQKDNDIIVQPDEFISDEDQAGSQSLKNGIGNDDNTHNSNLITPSQIRDTGDVKVDNAMVNKELNHVGSPVQNEGMQQTQAMVGSENPEDKSVKQHTEAIFVTDDRMHSLKDKEAKETESVLGEDPNGYVKDNEVSREGTATPGMLNRGKFSDESGSVEHSSWSNSLGTIIPVENDKSLALVQPKDIYFIGSGIKLPLQMVQNDDGAVHLSVDLDKLCSCKNHTCPKNHTAIETTVGTILEKEAELKDQLAETDAETDAETSEKMPASDIEEPISTHRSEREIVDSKWLEMKSSINDHLDETSEHLSIFKRSINQAEPTGNLITNNETKEPNKGKINIKISTDTSKMDIESKPDEKHIANNTNIKNVETKKTSSVDDALVKSPSYLFNQLLNKKFAEIKSKLAEMEKKNELQKKQQAFSQDMFKTWINWMNKPLIPAKKDTKAASDSADKSADLINKPITADKIQSVQSHSNPLLFPKPVKFNDILGKHNKGSEIFDDVLPIYKNVFQFKGEDSQNKLAKINGVATKDGKKNTGIAPKSKVNTLGDAVVKNQVDIMNNVLTWMKELAVPR